MNNAISPHNPFKSFNHNSKKMSCVLEQDILNLTDQLIELCNEQSIQDLLSYPLRHGD